MAIIIVSVKGELELLGALESLNKKEHFIRKTFNFIKHQVNMLAKSAVQNRVAARWTRSKVMKTEEGEVVVGEAVEGNLKVFEKIDQVQWKPTDNEHNQHGKKKQTSWPKIFIVGQGN